jgi:cytochrome c553
MRFAKLKIADLKLAVLAAVLCATAAQADEPASVRNCTWCHGTSAQGVSTAPRLAGQRHQYIEKQLASFNHHTRDNPFSRQFMWGAVASLSPQSARDLANYFSTLPPKAAGDGDPGLAATGKTIYELGIPDSNVVSCLVCHGPNAEGVRDIPRLGGLAYSYLKRRLAQWGEGYHAAVSYPMPRVARSLSPDDVDALASYLSFIR